MPGCLHLNSAAIFQFLKMPRLHFRASRVIANKKDPQVVSSRKSHPATTTPVMIAG
jgi:hypothetical protein